MERSSLMGCRVKSYEEWQEIIFFLFGEFQNDTKNMLSCNILKKQNTITHKSESIPPKINNNYRVNSFHNKANLESCLKVIQNIMWKSTLLSTFTMGSRRG